MNRFECRYGDPNSYRKWKSEFVGGIVGGILFWFVGGQGGAGGGGESNGFSSEGRGYEGGRSGGKDYDGRRGGRGSRNIDRYTRELDGAALPKEDFNNLIPFENNLYVEHPTMSSLLDHEVSACKICEITVEGHDVPKSL
jgi:ATP-dependent RNA helicase DDX5/DBP2